jgi:hypothetical protein
MPRPPEVTSSILRISLLVGVLLFGAVCWFTTRQPGWTPRSDFRPFRPAGYVAWAIAVAGVMLLRGRVDRARDDALRQRLNLMAWTCGEIVALYGGVVYFVTGDASWYLLGLAFMVGTFVVFPVRRERH